jgi:hypothetical protein
MVRPERFELPTCCSGGNRSIQLSYGRTDVGYSLHGNQRFVVYNPYLGAHSSGIVIRGPGLCGNEPNCACRANVVKRQLKFRAANR